MNKQNNKPHARTPGPWRMKTAVSVNSHGVHECDVYDGSFLVAIVRGMTIEECVANAKLIARGPTLIRAAKKALAEQPENAPMFRELADEIHKSE